MKRRKADSEQERKFLTAMIVSREFLAGVSAADLSLLPTRYAQQLAGWCLEHYRRYADAPNKAIESIYHSWVENENPEEDDAEAVHDFLTTLSGDYDTVRESLNVPHLLDGISAYLTLKGVAKLTDDLTAHLSFGRKDDAIAAIQSFRGVSLNDSIGYDPVNSAAAMTRAFAESSKPVIEFPGDAMRFFGGALVRDGLIGIQGPEKRGKTFWCLELVYRTLRERKRVAMFEVGDLSEAQLSRRMAVRMAGIPLPWPNYQHAPLEIKMPCRIQLVESTNDEGKAIRKPRVKFDVREFRRPIDEVSATIAQAKFRRTHKLPKDKPSVMFSAHPMGTVNVAGINSTLERWESELDFVPDVIVVDYADILAPEKERRDARDQVNDTWQALRRLSQKWHACVATPTQADAASYNVKTQTMANFSNDKRKNAHVTGMLGLNQTTEEKRMQIMRLNWLNLRESDFSTDDCLYVAQCIPLGMAFVKSVW